MHSIHFQAQEMVPTWKEEHLDFFLVPTGLLLMFGYHLFHLQRCISHAKTTVIGYENHSKRAWVARIMKLKAKDRGQAITVIGSNLSAATSFASTSLALCSLIGALIGSSYHNDYISKRVYGNKSTTIVYLKYVALLASFMFAFACFVQTARCFVHANFLISMPNCDVPVSNVERVVIRASNFWVVGLRLLYFSTNLLLWIFGPIPMFVSSVIIVVLLQYLDKNTDPLPQYNPLVSYDSPSKIDKETSKETVVISDSSKA
ncbi:hypothetical protein ACS0TY_018330 [Phlomoides rotata]